MAKKRNFDRFISFDLETTGLSETDKIIEFGAAKFNKGKVVDTFQALVNPGMRVPWEVYSLTGISEKELRAAPSLETVQDEILGFLGDSILLAHNAPFDTGFFERELPALENPIFDTLKFARMLLPYATNHKLETLYALFEKDEVQFHRALDDAIATGKVFLHLCAVLSALPEEIMVSLAAVAETTRDLCGELVLEVFSNRSKQRKIMKQNKLESLQKAPVNTMDFKSSKAHQLPPAKESSVIELLSDDTFLTGALGKYEHRDEQLQLAKKVMASFQDDSILISEAGTGTGKTFAYLIPAILWSSNHNERVLVSTYTKNLEDQIFHSDLRAILSTLKIDFSACIIKGRNNYLCNKRWDEMMHVHFRTLEEADKQGLLKLIVWQYYTRTGDISENSSFWLSEHFPLWVRLSSDMKDCGMHTCPYFNECYLANIRRAAQQANIIVLNHALLFTDLQSDQKIIGEYERLIIDEAHNLEKAATDFLGISVTSIQIESILDRMLKRERGFLSTIRDMLALYGEEKTGVALPALNNALHAVRAARETFSELTERISEEFGKLVYKGSMRLKSGSQLTEDIEPYNQELYDHFQTINNLLQSFLRTASDKLIKIVDKRFIDEISQILEESMECSRNLVSILSCDRKDQCYWLEASERNGFMKFMSAPINVAPVLRTQLFDLLKSAVLVSATILVEGTFEYFLNKVGLAGYDRAEVIGLGSSFDYSRQAFSVIPLFIADPQQKGFLVDVADIVRKVALKTRKGTLVLFTSYKLLNGVYDYVIESFHQNGIPLLAQNRSGSRYTIAREFREIEHSVLLGTYSFWEGFDVPGKALENLIITKLPFPAPNEPMMEARGEFLEMKGLSPFDRLFVPEAIIRLRQGFGRLLRSKEDRGTIIILDTRIMRRNYGKRFLLSLPTKVSASYYEEDFFESIMRFWET